MTKFFDLPGILEATIGGTRSRAVSAGVDPNEYEAVTSRLQSIDDWQPHLRAAGRTHRALAEDASTAGRAASAAEAYLAASLWFHFSTTLPGPDRLGHAESADSYRKALQHSHSDAEWIQGADFIGVLRRPAAAKDAPVVLVVPGLDSSIAEFHTVAEALLRRGIATLSIDGPGQGELAPNTAPTADYQLVVGQAIDVLEQRRDVDTDRIGLIALSLGGYYGAVALAHEPRLHAGVLVSGLDRMSWPELPPFVTHTLMLRTGTEQAAKDFADRVDLSEVAPSITQPLLVVDGGQDVIPGVVNGEPLARNAQRGEYLSISEGDHLVANARWKWLPHAADRLAHWLV
ncbi:alpha/beta hydrolase family protein [Rhodococcus qingshengii]|uniref:alpha/beta hydrolase family protein n=2 Tax=Rhodococcus qingshengii TaxID=334542 RepID=UPI001E47A2E3|nr:alpha/beta fold hydrolase [Rhodococcus qingshengii]UDF19366.1 alpha/beta hydrolase [Rhodococcus qingshengii]